MEAKILIVDDQPDNLEAIFRFFEEDNAPYELLQALSADMALKIATKEIPDLIITDWEMPEMDGIALIENLKKNKATKDIPIIMCTGVMTSSENLYTALEAGAVDYIRKPIDRTELIARTRANLHLADNYRRIKKLNQSLISLSQFKEDMTHMIVHDLKSPLAAIINIDLLKSEENRIGMVKHAGYKMLSLVQNILDVYKYEKIQLELNKGQHKLIDIVNDAIRELSYIAQQKNISFKIKIDCDFTALVDREIIKRVFTNLLSNAVKFSPSNDKITIKAQVVENNNTHIKVCNNGPVIPKEKHKEIFKKFGQGEKRAEVNVASTGLGLTFCMLAIEAHGGEIGVNSEPESNVEFWFNVPNEDDFNCKNYDLSRKGRYDIKLLKSELEYLKPFVIKLASNEVFEVSSINNCLKEIKSNSTNIKKWVKLIEEAVYEGDNKSYQKLLLIDALC